MNIRLAVWVLAACQILVTSSPLLARDDYGLLTRGEKRVYHACLYAHYIDYYCRTHAWGFNQQSFRDCVIANDACECSIANGGYWGPYIDDACRALHPARRL
jgi:hypothetical protein